MSYKQGLGIIAIKNIRIWAYTCSPMKPKNGKFNLIIF